jgi:hypothetical protein
MLSGSGRYGRKPRLLKLRQKEKQPLKPKRNRLV